MSLKAAVDTLDEVPEPARGLYAEKDGKFHLAVEGMAPKAKVDEFRESNVTLRRELDALRARFDGVDPDKFRELSDKAQRERDRKLIDAGKVDELVTERVNAMKADHDKQIKSVADERARLTAQLEGLVIDNAIRDHAAKAGVRASAIEDVLLRGRALFRLQDGKAMPMEGDKPIYGKSGDPMGIDEWIGTLTERAPHLFESSQGSGARGVGAPPVGGNTLRRDDSKAFLANLKDIASGKLRVG